MSERQYQRRPEFGFTPYFSDEEIERIAADQLDEEERNPEGRNLPRFPQRQTDVFRLLMEIPETERGGVLKRIESAKRLIETRKRREAHLRSYAEAYAYSRIPNLGFSNTIGVPMSTLEKYDELEKDPELKAAVREQYDKDERAAQNEAVRKEKEVWATNLERLSARLTELREYSDSNEERLLALARVLRAQLSEIRDILRENGSL